MLRDEARVDAEKTMETRKQQTRADDEHERQRDLRDDERAADVPRRPAGRP